MKIPTFSALCIVSLGFILSACGNAGAPTASNSTANTANNSPVTAISEETIQPDQLVKNLYEAHKADASPFFQTQNRALVDKYFTKNLADLIWQDAVGANGEDGAIDFDPLYGSQDPQISDFTIMETGWGGDKKFGPEDEAVVQVTFKDSGKERMISYQFKQSEDKSWKIYDIHYRNDGEEVKLAEVLSTGVAPAESTRERPTSERKAIADALRLPIEQELKQKVVFKIDHLGVQDNWAFLKGVPQQPDSSAIQYGGTRYQAAIDAGAFDDGIVALLRKSGNEWQVVQYVIGATDVPYVEWDKEYQAPSAIFQE